MRRRRSWPDPERCGRPSEWINSTRAQGVEKSRRIVANVRLVIISAEGLSEDGIAELLQGVADSMAPRTGPGSATLQETLASGAVTLRNVETAAGHPLSSTDLPETGGDALKELDLELTEARERRNAAREEHQRLIPQRSARVSRVKMSTETRGRMPRKMNRRYSIDGAGEFSAIEAAAKLGCVPAAVRLASQRAQMCKGHAIAGVGQTVPSAAERMAGKLPDGGDRRRGPRVDRMMITCDEHPEWGTIDVEKAANLTGRHHSGIRLALKLDRPIKGLMFRKAEAGDVTGAGAGLQVIGEATRELGKGVMLNSSEKPQAAGQPKAPAAAAEPLEAKPAGARKVWVAGAGEFTLREACGKCGVSFDVLRRRLDNGGGECRNATVYWADEYLAKVAKARG